MKEEISDIREKLDEFPTRTKFEEIKKRVKFLETKLGITLR
ncbi:MAG: hypothetical protein ACD_58C00318G0006 [uncultured bacterium]|nr:MAG: hypothetical protein ACD_58C00318G0006 [uncultured bacterium]